MCNNRHRKLSCFRARLRPWTGVLGVFSPSNALYPEDGNLSQHLDIALLVLTLGLARWAVKMVKPLLTYLEGSNLGESKAKNRVDPVWCLQLKVPQDTPRGYFGNRSLISSNQVGGSLSFMLWLWKIKVIFQAGEFWDIWITWRYL